MENPSYKNKNIESKYPNNVRKNQFLKVKNSLLELEKYNIELKDRELKDRQVRIKRERDQRSIFETNYGVYRWYGEVRIKKMKRRSPIKNT